MPDTNGLRKSISVGSSAFSGGGDIPREHAREGDDVSPPLTIRDLPDGTRVVAVVVEDPDAPRETFTHWTVWNVAAHDGHVELEEGVDASAIGATEGTNDFGDRGYGGPQPPSGTHRYRFRVFALREPLDLAEGAHPHEVTRAIEDAGPLAWGELVGVYSKRAEQKMARGRK